MKTHSYLLLVCLCLIALTQSVHLRKQISALQANNIPAGMYFIQVPGTGKVYQCPYVSLYDPVSAYQGVGLIQATYNRTPSQSFVIEPLGNGNYKITVVLSTLVLTMPGTSPGTKPIQSDWTGALNQQWKINPFSNCVGCGLAGYTITSATAGLPIGVSTTQDGSQVVQQGQGFLYQYVTVDFLPKSIDYSKPISAQGFFQVPDGNYMIKIVGINKVFDIAGASQTSGANLIQNTMNGGLNQKFKVQSIGSGKYKITALHSGQLLNVYGGLMNVGTKIIQWPLSNTANEEWKIEYYKACTACVVSGYRIVSVSSGLELGAPNTATQQDGSIITQQLTNYPVKISVVDFIPY